jgi:hypothetical protein
MREALLQYAKTGAMTKEQVAELLNLRPEAVRRMSKDGRLPRIPGVKPIRFDPAKLMQVLCPDAPAKPRRSLTIEGHKTDAKRPKGGYRKCL